MTFPDFLQSFFLFSGASFFTLASLLLLVKFLQLHREPVYEEDDDEDDTEEFRN